MGSTTNAKDWILKYKEDKSCFICGYKKYTAILEFHHKKQKLSKQNLFIGEIGRELIQNPKQKRMYPN